MFEQYGGTGKRMTIENGYDWTLPETLDKAIHEYDLHRPEVVWGSPECGPFSSTQNMNQNTPEQIAELQVKRQYAAKIAINVIAFLNYAASQ